MWKDFTTLQITINFPRTSRFADFSSILRVLSVSYLYDKFVERCSKNGGQYSNKKSHDRKPLAENKVKPGQPEKEITDILNEVK